MGRRPTPFRPGTGSAEPATFAEWTEADHPRNDQGEFVKTGDLEAAKTDVVKAHKLRLEVTDPGERKKLDAIVGGGTAGHSVVLPKNPRKLNIGQIHAAMVQLGYQIGRMRYDQKAGTTVWDLTKPDGSRTAATADEVRETIYQGAASGDRRAKRPPATFAEHKYANTHVDLTEVGPHPQLNGRLPWQAVCELTNRIDDNDLAAEGRELSPHITVKHGLHTDDPAEVGRVVAGFGPVRVRLGSIGMFAADGPTGADVVWLGVESPDLIRLNGQIAAALPYTSKHPAYTPHVTLAYVEPGQGAKHVGPSGLEGIDLVFDCLVFSNRDRRRTVLPLVGPATFDEGPGFTGTITDAAGRKRKYQDGRPVPIGGTDGDRKPGPEYDRKPPEQAPAPAADPAHQELTAHLVGQLKPELQQHPGIGRRVALAVAKIYPKVEYAARRLSMLSLEFQADVLDTVEDYESIAKQRTALGVTAGTATGNDPFGQHLGIPGHVALPLIAKAVGFIAGKVAKRVSQHAELPDPADVVLELLAAYRALSGREAEPLPSREEVAAKLAEKQAARAAGEQ